MGCLPLPDNTTLSLPRLPLIVMPHTEAGFLCATEILPVIRVLVLNSTNAIQAPFVTCTAAIAAGYLPAGYTLKVIMIPVMAGPVTASAWSWMTLECPCHRRARPVKLSTTRRGLTGVAVNY